MRVGARVHEDEGNGKDEGDNDNDDVAQGRQCCHRRHHCCIVGCTRTRVRVRKGNSVR